MQYKYNEELTKLASFNKTDGCFSDYSEKKISAYRWTFSNIDDKRNFIPMASNKENFSLAKTCNGWALSFHKVESKSRESWKKLIADKPKKYKKIGTHIAFGEILKTDGKCSEPEKSSHFNLIEYGDVVLIERFKILDCLLENETLEPMG